MAGQYLELVENFAGFAEMHWNELKESYDAQGSGVTWARGNGGVCLVNAVLLTEFPDKKEFSPRKFPRERLLDHTRRAIRQLCLTNANCTHPRAIRAGSWGGKDPKGKGWHWQAGLETEHWVLAAHLLRARLDEETRAMVKQVATAEADGAIRSIPSARPGDTAADDCSWNAGILGVVAAIYAEDPRAAKWDEWAKRWALNMNGRQIDRTSNRMIDGRPLKEWLDSTNVFADFTLENHGFWDLPYQFGYAALAEPLIAYRICGRPIPEAFTADSKIIGESIVKWLILPDGDLLCPQGIDWAERDVQHSWGFTLLGTYLDQPWALAADRRCLDLLSARQAKFADGSIHALDFGYETDLAVVWTFSALLHKYFGKPEASAVFEEPRGAKIFPHVAAAVHRSADLVSSVTWFRNRQAILVCPNNLDATADRPSFTRYDRESGTGWIRLKGAKKHGAFRVIGEPIIQQQDGCLAVNFHREVPGVARQEIGYCSLPTGAVLVHSRWVALKEIQIEELVNHPFRWVEIDKFLSKPPVQAAGTNGWDIDGKLRMQIFGAKSGKIVAGGINGSMEPARKAIPQENLHDSVCIYQPLLPGKTPAQPKLVDGGYRLGEWTIRCQANGNIVFAKR